LAEEGINCPHKALSSWVQGETSLEKKARTMRDSIQSKKHIAKKQQQKKTLLRNIHLNLGWAFMKINTIFRSYAK